MNKILRRIVLAIKGCPKCGQANPDSTNYCFGCGAQL